MEEKEATKQNTDILNQIGDLRLGLDVTTKCIEATNGNIDKFVQECKTEKDKQISPIVKKFNINVGATVPRAITNSTQPD